MQRIAPPGAPAVAAVPEAPAVPAAQPATPPATAPDPTMRNARRVTSLMAALGAETARAVTNFPSRPGESCRRCIGHALLHESVRLAWACKVPMYVVNASAAVRAQIELVESYSLGG